MKKFSIENLKEKDIKIVERKKIIFLIPIVIILLSIIAGAVYSLTLGSAFNMGMDFTGGYTITIKAGAVINEDNYKEYSSKIEKIVKDYKFEYEGKEYPVRYENIQKLGSGTETSLRIQYRADRSISKKNQDTIMEKLSDDLVDKLNQIVSMLEPSSVIISGNQATITFDQPVKAHVDDNSIKNALLAAGVQVEGNITHPTENDKINYQKIVFNFSGSANESQIKEATTIDRYFSAKAFSGDMISGTVSMTLIRSAILAVAISLVLMLIYIFIRFTFSSGIAAILCLLHDVIIMTAMMVVFRIEITSTFIAALITILGYSINNTIVLFDRVRENKAASLSANKQETASDVANQSIKDILTRSIYTTITTLIMIGMIAIVCAIGGISSMVSFALPIIFGLIAGLYSSALIAPSIWVVLRRNSLGELKKSKKELKNSAKEATIGAK